MNSVRLLLAMTAISLWLSPATAQTPPGSLPGNVTSATSLTDAQKQQVADYADYWGAQLIEGDDPQVAEARNQLLTPLQGANISEAFRDEMSLRLFEPIRDALASERVIVRLNATMVVPEMSGSTTADLLGTALGDRSPAVRYWAALGIEPLAETLAANPRTAAALEQLHQRIVAVTRDESLPVVFGPLLNGLVTIQRPDAVTDALTLMNDRIDRHAQNPTLSLASEVQALKAVFQRIQVGASVPQGDEAYRWIARVCYRYLALAADALAMDPFDDATGEVKQSYETMIREADTRLRFAVGRRLAPEATLPSPIDAWIGTDDWNAIRELVRTDWVLLLTGDPIRFNPRQLAVNVQAPN